MNIEIEVTKKEKATIQLETPAYFKTEYGFRDVMVLEDFIIEVGDEICLFHEKNSLFGRFNEVLHTCINYEKSTVENYSARMSNFIDKVYLSKAHNFLGNRDLPTPEKLAEIVTDIEEDLPV